MSDLGAIFHVKKAGVQYNAHAYTTIDECPEPNLKVNFKGQQAYVKLENKGEGDVPCYVKPKSEDKIYQVRKEAIPTGQLPVSGNITFTVPSGIKVIAVQVESSIRYIGVTPNTTHSLVWSMVVGNNYDVYTLRCKSHNNIVWGRGFDSGRYATLAWSPEINKQRIVESDYN